MTSEHTAERGVYLDRLRDRLLDLTESYPTCAIVVGGLDQGTYEFIHGSELHALLAQSTAPPAVGAAERDDDPTQPGTAAARLAVLIDELDKRFPLSDADAYSARPPEVLLLANIDARLARAPSEAHDGDDTVPAEQFLREEAAGRRMATEIDDLRIRLREAEELLREALQSIEGVGHCNYAGGSHEAHVSGCLHCRLFRFVRPNPADTRLPHLGTCAWPRSAGDEDCPACNARKASTTAVVSGDKPLTEEGREAIADVAQAALRHQARQPLSDDRVRETHVESVTAERNERMLQILAGYKDVDWTEFRAGYVRALIEKVAELRRLLTAQSAPAPCPGSGATILYGTSYVCGACGSRGKVVDGKVPVHGVGEDKPVESALAPTRRPAQLSDGEVRDEAYLRSLTTDWEHEVFRRGVRCGEGRYLRNVEAPTSERNSADGETTR